MSLNWYFLLFLFAFARFDSTSAGTFSVDYTNQQFLKDGQPFQYISGSIHYWRIHPDYWNDRLQRVRALGLNAIQTYIAWNLHEPFEGTFDFSGRNNISQFLTLAQQNGLYVLLRPTPYVNAELEYGGLPYWLNKYDGIKLRSHDPIYINAVQNYYNVLLDIIQPFLYKNGGPVLMLQIENEYGFMGACDHNYTSWLANAIWSKLGNDVLLYTTDPSNNLKCGAVPGTVATVDFAPSDNHTQIDAHFQQQDAASGGAPHTCSEFYNDWFMYWGLNSTTAGQNYHNRNISVYIDNIDYIHSQKKGNVNIYLVHGGTNFGFINGAKEQGGIIPTYWAASPIAENGNITDIYLAIRTYLNNLPGWSTKPLAIPNNNPTSAYGQVTLSKVGQNLISTLTQIQESCQGPSQDPISFDHLDHPYGYVLYTTTITQGGNTINAPNIRDYGYVFLNNVYQGMISRDNRTSLKISATQGDVLRILVENRARQSFIIAEYETVDIKGLHNNVTLDGNLLQNWYQCGINLTKASIDSLSGSNFFDENTSSAFPQKAVSQPGVYIGQFNASVIQDTYFDATGWGKGQFFINGHNIGRYWPTLGPQNTLYIPKPYIQPTNTILLIELIGAQQNYVNFIDHLILFI